MKRTIPLLVLCGLAGCAQEFPLPMTAAEFRTYDSGPALVAYLAQADASPAVCTLTATGPHLSALSKEVDSALVDGLVDGKIAPDLWRRCTETLARSAPPGPAALLVDAIGRGYKSLLKRHEFEQSTVEQERLRAMQRFYLERKAGINGVADAALFADLRTALANHKLGRVAAALGQELLNTVDIERGVWNGQPVTAALLDDRYAKGDDATLLRFAERLPDAQLRSDAKRRVIRLRIATSKYPEVRANAAAVEEAMMKSGINAVALADHPAISGAIDAQKVPIRGVLVQQDLWRQTAKLVGFASDRPSLSVLPELKLRGALSVQVQGIAQPVTLCGSKKALDVSPCVAPADVTIANPLAYLDKGGAFHFVDHIAMADAVGLTVAHDFVLPIHVGKVAVASFDWRLWYARPADFVVTGSTPGSNAPNLTVAVAVHDDGRYLYRVSSEGGSYLAVAEPSDSAAFHVVSRGTQGYAGADGSSGTDGSSGGECSDGGDGGDGGDGDDGGPGGNGGDVTVSLTCAGSCQAPLALLQTTILSQGGAGGPGGAGGSGGNGGSGGPGRSPTYHTDSDGNQVEDDPGCSAGSSGSSGANGASGADGAAGSPGTVHFLRVS